LAWQTSSSASNCDPIAADPLVLSKKPLKKFMDNLPPSAADASKPEQNPPVAQQLKSQVESAKKEAAKLKGGASEQAAVSFESAKTNIMEAAQEAAGYGQGVVNEQKDRLAEIVEKYGQTAKAASEKLDQEGHAALANRAGEMAKRLDRASTYLRDKNLSEIYYDAEHFTRRRPEIVFGMMFAAGLVAARFLKASDRGAASSRPLNIESKKETLQSL
jgi:hypothetical protein